MKGPKLNWFDRMNVEVSFAEENLELPILEPKEKQYKLNWFDRMMIDVTFAEANIDLMQHAVVEEPKQMTDSATRTKKSRIAQSRRPTISMR
jgi:hypothetical protein